MTCKVPSRALLCGSKPVWIWIRASLITVQERCGWYLSGIKRWWSSIAILFCECVGKIHVTQNLLFKSTLSTPFSGTKCVTNVVQQQYVFEPAYYVQVFCQALPCTLTCLILTKKAKGLTPKLSLSLYLHWNTQAEGGGVPAWGHVEARRI